MYALSQEVLRTDVSGMPLEWIDYRDAVRLHFMGQVAYSFGQPLFRLRGGSDIAELSAALRRGLGVDVAVALCEPGGTAALTQVESRQKPIRLIDERG